MVTEYIIYTALTLSIGLLASIYGTQLGALLSELMLEELHSGRNPIWGALQKKSSEIWKDKENVKLFSNDFFTIRPIPVVIFTGLTEFVILVLVTRGVLSLSLISIVLTIVGLIVGVTLVSSVVSFLIGKVIVYYAPRRKMERERELRLKRMRGTPKVKVYKCGICGETSPTGQYVVRGGMPLCRRHAELFRDIRDVYECPSCGYKFAPGDNRDYFEEHRCSNCGRHLDDSSWG